MSFGAWFWQMNLSSDSQHSCKKCDSFVLRNKPFPQRNHSLPCLFCLKHHRYSRVSLQKMKIATNTKWIVNLALASSPHDQWWIKWEICCFFGCNKPWLNSSTCVRELHYLLLSRNFFYSSVVPQLKIPLGERL